MSDPQLLSAPAGRHRARARLVALTTGYVPHQEPDEAVPDDAVPDDQLRDDPDPTAADATDGMAGARRALGDGAVPTGRAGRLVRRWVPAQAREARWDPGRPGARTLSAVAALAAVLAAVGVWSGRPVPEPVPALPVLPAVAPAAAEGPTGAAAAAGGAEAGAELVISVAGRVARPGLVRVPDGARVADAVEAAGGPLPDTDLTLLNLARRLGDGEQLLVGIAPPPGAAPDAAGPAAAAGGSAPGAAVDLNTATEDQLDTLPGVGPVTAQRILDWRAANGRFASVDQLREVDGIGEARFATLKDLVRV